MNYFSWSTPSVLSRIDCNVSGGGDIYMRSVGTKTKFVVLFNFTSTKTSTRPAPAQASAGQQGRSLLAA